MYSFVPDPSFPLGQYGEGRRVKSETLAGLLVVSWS